MKFNDLKVIQSYILTTAKYDFSVYEKKIMYRLVQIAQSDLQGKKLDKNYVVGENLFGDRKIKMKYSDVLGEGDRNHPRIKKALWSLVEKFIEYDNTTTGWESKFSIIQGPKVSKTTKELEFSVNEILWDVILAISAKGWRKFDLKTAMSFEGVYSMRFFELFSEQENGSFQQYKIDDLKEMFGIVGKYKRVNDFVRYVLDAAKKELDAKSPYSFTYKMVKAKGSRKYTSVLFCIVHIPANQNENSEKKSLQMQTSAAWSLGKQNRDYLIDNYGFEEKGIRSNMDLFKSADKAFDLSEFLTKQKRTAEETARNKSAWIIGAIRKHLANIELKKASKKGDDLINDLGDAFTSK